jgi:predicted lipid-binding transport protein (Tim44 family)
MHPACATLPVPATANRPGFARFLLVPLVFTLFLALFLAFTGQADAARLGGGKSFGSKPSYSRPAAPPKQSPDMQRQATPGQQAAPGASRFGGLGGMFGGLLMGGLIGSMLFGGGFAGPGMLDILLIGGGLFLLFRFLRARRQASQPQYARAGLGADREAGYSGGSSGGYGGGWSNLGADDRAAPEASRVVMPRGVDEKEFLAGAKTLYTRLQNSWDKRDLNDIAEFTAPEVHAEIARQAAADPTPGRTEILMIDARVLEARQSGSETVISVFFDVLLREDGSAGSPTQAREVWHFGRDEAAPAPEWKLEGLQQLEI